VIQVGVLTTSFQILSLVDNAAWQGIRQYRLGEVSLKGYRIRGGSFLNLLPVAGFPGKPGGQAAYTEIITVSGKLDNRSVKIDWVL
jgi:hypothetical protein